MSDRSAQVLKEALTLPSSERAELVEHLLRSLDPPSRNKIDDLWAEEAEERIDAFEQGKIRTISAKRVFDKIDGRKM